MLPVSGAEQLKTSDAKPILPSCSAIRLYSRLVSCTPSNWNVSSTWVWPLCGGMKKFHRPGGLGLGLQLLDDLDDLPALGLPSTFISAS
jgi:hypothetical protein